MTNIPSGYALIRTEFQMAGANYPAVITIGVQRLNPYTAHDINVTWWAGVLNGGTSSYPLDPAGYTAACTVKETSVLLNVGGVMTTDVVTHNQVGTGSWPPPPPNTAIIQRKATGLAGRANRGRMYWPAIFVDQAAIDTDGTMSGAPFTHFQSVAAGMLAHMNSNFISPVIIHASGATPTPISSLSVVEPIAATQRRRMRR